ncbi:MAG TPA: hypothetical protein VFR81_11590, partial [Longimicrobium sp.]|nr:hypothetical protein [Longimicrobium sp.]
MNARPLSAALLRRLGEAADGYRTGRPIYVVACYDDPRNDLRVFERESDAVEHLARAGDRFGMFGPFATPADGSATGSPVREVAVTLHASDGGERVVRLDGAKYDSFFWSASAIDKFAVPYYAATAGLDNAAEMRRRATQGPVCALIHMPTSEWTPEIFDGYGAPGDPEVAMEVAMVTLILHDGREMRIDGREHDAVFWSLSAVDKFAVPYYARTDGAEYAAEMRRKAAKGPVCAIIHLPRSEYVDQTAEQFDGYGAPEASAGEVVEVTMTLRDKAGVERTIRLDGREHDALFWTASAIDKFAVPYYARTDGAEFAAEMRRRAMQGPVCGLVHLPRSAWMTVGEEEFDGYGASDDSQARLEVIEVTLTLHDGREVRIDGREHDAVFWSLSAIDKFAVPYYARTDGAEYAAEMRRRAATGPVCGLAHMPKSEYVQLEPGGDEEFQGYDAPEASAGEVVEVTMTLRD